MSEQAKSLEEILKPFKSHIQFLCSEIERLDKENMIWRSKYILLKRGIPVEEIERMYREVK